MKNAALGVLIGVVALSGAISWQGVAQDVLTVPLATHDARAEGKLIALATGLDENRQQVVLIDPRTQVMGVYHIKRETGEIVLKSVRNFSWDLQLVQFNGTQPLPQEIRGLLNANAK
jgi:hypothetical protein